jgi:hypothetical protein
MAESVASSQSVGAPPFVNAGAGNRDTIVLVRWALTITCGYLVLFSDPVAGAAALAPLVIVAFLASNLIIGRLPAQSVNSPSLHLGVAALDTVLIGLSLYCAGQLSVELVVLLLGVLVLAIAGIRLGIIAALTIGLAGVSLLLVAVNGSEPLHHTSMLLRVPFLLAAAVAYAWLADLGRRESAGVPTAETVNDIARELSAQSESIERCQAAAAQGLVGVTQRLLVEIAQANQDMRVKVAGTQIAEVQAQRAPAVAHSAA